MKNRQQRKYNILTFTHNFVVKKIKAIKNKNVQNTSKLTKYRKNNFKNGLKDLKPKLIHYCYTQIAAKRKKTIAKYRKILSLLLWEKIIKTIFLLTKCKDK